MKKLFSITLLSLACAQPITHAQEHAGFFDSKTSFLTALFAGSAIVYRIIDRLRTPTNDLLIALAQKDLLTYQNNSKKTFEKIYHDLQSGNQANAETHLVELEKLLGQRINLNNAHLIISQTINTFDQHVKAISKRLSSQFTNDDRKGSFFETDKRDAAVEKLEAMLHEIQQERINVAKIHDCFKQAGIGYEWYTLHHSLDFDSIFTIISGATLAGLLAYKFVQWNIEHADWERANFQKRINARIKQAIADSKN